MQTLIPSQARNGYTSRRKRGHKAQISFWTSMYLNYERISSTTAAGLASRMLLASRDPFIHTWTPGSDTGLNTSDKTSIWNSFLSMSLSIFHPCRYPSCSRVLSPTGLKCKGQLGPWHLWLVPPPPDVEMPLGMEHNPPYPCAWLLGMPETLFCRAGQGRGSWTRLPGSLHSGRSGLLSPDTASISATGPSPGPAVQAS